MLSTANTQQTISPWGAVLVGQYSKSSGGRRWELHFQSANMATFSKYCYIRGAEPKLLVAGCVVLLHATEKVSDNQSELRTEPCKSSLIGNITRKCGGGGKGNGATSGLEEHHLTTQWQAVSFSHKHQSFERFDADES